MGRGQFSGNFGCLRALTTAVGPLLMGRLFSWGRARFVSADGKPRVNLGFLAAALLGCVLPEVLHQLYRRASWRAAREKQPDCRG